MTMSEHTAAQQRRAGKTGGRNGAMATRARWSGMRQRVTDAMRYRTHEKTAEQWAIELGVSHQTVRRVAKQLNERTKGSATNDDATVAVMKRWIRCPIVGRSHASTLRAIERDREEGLL